MSSSTVYEGSRTITGIEVVADGEPLDERFDLHRYINSWFEWGYEGDAPKQLALALLAHHLGDDTKAMELAEPFMKEVVANLDNDWTLTADQIAAAVDRLAAAA